LLAPAVAEAEVERDGLVWGDERWRVPWLRGLRRVPADAAWPRLMSVPHERAVGSLGPDFIRWAEARSGRPLRWWQKLAATRMLEIDADGRLCWETILLTMPRQLGKSWLLRELCFWRIHKAEHFGEAQDVLHTGKDLRVCIEVQRPARLWAKVRPDEYKVREANGDVHIEHRASASRWMLQAPVMAAFGFSVPFAVADEVWKVAPEVIEEGIVPTMVEREQPQLLLVSTAHRRSTSLMLSWRAAAVAGLEDGDGSLLLEWSAPRGADMADETVWRASSAHWSPRREKTIRAQLEAALAGTLRAEDEPDPAESFRSQWLNEWPVRLADYSAGVEDLLPPGVWADLADPEAPSTGPVWAALEDDAGLGAAAAFVSKTADGRLELDGCRCETWDEAVAQVEAVAAVRPLRALHVGASLIARVPRGFSPPPSRAGGTETRTGLPLLRDLALGGMLVHDGERRDLDRAVALARVKEMPSGLFLIPGHGAPHLVKALVWAVSAAHRPTPVPSIS
jgi:hypothetical protein